MRDYFLWLAKLLTILAIIFIGIPIFMGGLMVALQTATSEGIHGERNVVAVVELTGMIESAKDIVEQLHKQAKNDQVKGIILHIDSPGGAVGPSQEIFETVKVLKEKKPVVAVMGALAASGGLYSAVSAARIYAQPGTLTGSIGVIMQVPNFTKVTERIGVDMITVKSGERKDIGNTFRPMTPEEREFLEHTIRLVHDQFIQAVAQGRNLDEAKVREFADGRVIIGSQAKELGLIDDFGDVYRGARAVFEILGTPLRDDESPTLIYPGEKFGELKRVLESVSSITRVFAPAPMQLRFEMQ